ncbi:MAG: head GIN domain-containing protein [Pseudobacter sp.]|uniref:head GIN domain-containing protein n=1 Tax=Pseudobacter sp. TaxID=2045420 RepID=UPI003F7F7759
MKKNQLVAVVLFALCSYLMVSCKKKITGEGPSVKQERTVNSFNRITSAIDDITYVTQEGNFKLTIEAQQNILDKIETPVLNERLIIRFKKGTRLGSHDPVVVRVSAPVIKGLGVEGSSDLQATNDIVCNEGLDLHLSGSGDVKVKGIDVTGELTASISGSGSISALSGWASNAKFSISGSGGIYMLPVTVKKVKAEISGSGNVKTKATETLDAKISGSGNVWYEGNPQITTSISGSGKVSKAQ